MIAFAVDFMEMDKILCFPTHCDRTGTFRAILQEASLEMKCDVCVCVFLLELHWTVHVGGMVAWRLALLPPESLHVSPKFHR